MKARGRTRPGRPKLVPISDEMKEWSAMLSQEVSGWPDVTSRSMFGFVSFYRKQVIFAALPQSRAPRTPNSFMFRFALMPAELEEKARKSSQMRMDHGPGAKWWAFELSSTGDLRDALWWLNQAYEAAKTRRAK